MEDYEKRRASFIARVVSDIGRPGPGAYEKVLIAFEVIDNAIKLLSFTSAPIPQQLKDILLVTEAELCFASLIKTQRDIALYTKFSPFSRELFESYIGKVYDAYQAASHIIDEVRSEGGIRVSESNIHVRIYPLR